MESTEDITRAKDAKARKRLAWSVAILVFLLTYGVLVARHDHWGAALGWLPAIIVAAVFGWCSYRFRWLGVIVTTVFEIVFVILDFVVAVIAG